MLKDHYGSHGHRVRSVVALALAAAVAATRAHAEVSFDEKRLLTVPATPEGWLQEDLEPAVEVSDSPNERA